MGKIKANFSAIALTIASIALAVGIHMATTYPTEVLAVIVVAMMGFRCIMRITDPPKLTNDQILDAAAFCMDEAFKVLQGKLSVFDHVLTTDIPYADGSGYGRYLRWEYAYSDIGGIPIVKIGLLNLSKTVLSDSTLNIERRVIQTLIDDNLRRFLVPNISNPFYRDGTPSLVLVNIFDDGTYIGFDFVCVQDDKTADFVHRHNLPPDGDDTDDQDF